MKNIAITGVTGFVGQNLSNYLSDFLIHGISRKKTEQCISYEELSTENLNEFDVFVHLAGKAHDLKKTSQDQDYFEVNTELTKRLFNQFLESSCKTFIYMSSVKAAADEVQGFLDENCIPNPVTVYGKSKLDAETYILGKKMPKDKRVYILRPCMIHGPGNKGNLNVLYSFVEKGIPYPFGKYVNQRSFLSVENLCFVIKELIENKNIPSGVYHVADDETVSTNELVQIIGKTIRKSAKIINLPKFLVNVLAAVGDIIPLPINSERVQKLTENYCVSNTKIKKAIGKEFPLSAKEGIERTIKSFIQPK
ncbi:NAD-dependent epimerase/dehydratase family protein [Flavicella marina]|uniref:NAD-dependent epimerase/dehydratase family protein n=1 Tax=Flavicella marina TaxID=1475951 RepID=UPI001264FEB4|nr:NAD-dependent epimerase/dehydratase family protein [Flavicella marina]